jgi:hypothetical protein
LPKRIAGVGSIFAQRLRSRETAFGLTAVHMDLQTGKSCAFPEEILAGGQPMMINYDPAHMNGA